MRVPIAWLREYVDLPESAQAIADRLAMIGFPVDAIETPPVITKVVIGKLRELVKHPNADKLQIGTIDIGNEKPLTIATAATNVADGQTIAIAQIGAQLPHLTIGPRKMRGVDSEGMMISAEELGLPAEWFEDGILQFDDHLAPGTDVVSHFSLQDAVLDVDVTSNRPDCLSIVGLARELASALGVPLRAPDFTNPGTTPDPTPPRVDLDTPDGVRFVAQRFTNVRAGVAPAWMRIRLAQAGQRPINTLVDISNYVMLETGQPLHFYDDAKIANHHLIVRDGRAGEEFVALDDAEYELDSRSLVVADEKQAQCLAGLKGGKSSEVDDRTTAIVLEAANFSGPRVRRMSAQLALRTDASTRHEKSLPLALTDMGAARAAHLLVQAGATAYAPHAFGAEVRAHDAITVRWSDVPRLLGVNWEPATCERYLQALGFATMNRGDSVSVVPPPWRKDVTQSADVIEEIARMGGYERIPAVVPEVPAHDIPSDDYDLEQRIASTLATLGYYEIISFSLHGHSLFDKLQRAGIPSTHQATEVLNPLSEDQRYLRTTLSPGLLDYFARVGKPVAAFEIGHTFNCDQCKSTNHDDCFVNELAQVTFGFAVTDVKANSGVDPSFLRIKGDAQELIRQLSGLATEASPDKRNGLHPGKTAVLMTDGEEIAAIGQVDPRLTRVFGIEGSVYLCNIYLEKIPHREQVRYAPPSRFPSTYRDVAAIVPLDITAAQLQNTIALAVGEICSGVRAFDEYRGPQVGEDRKSVALRVTMQRDDATLTDEEADAAMTRAIATLRDKYGATIRE